MNVRYSGCQGVELYPESGGLKDELDRRFCDLAKGQAQKVYFCGSDSEGVEAAIKFARVYTGRAGLL